MKEGTVLDANRSLLMSKKVFLHTHAYSLFSAEKSFRDGKERKNKSNFIRSSL
jgi:hypothetical protein